LLQYQSVFKLHNLNYYLSNKLSMRYFPIMLLLSTLFLSCKSTQNTTYKTPESTKAISRQSVKNSKQPAPIVNDTTFVNLRAYSADFVFDMKYATKDNFLKSKVYNCAECYLRYKTAKALIKANDSFMKLGYQIKIYDCYRPLDIQKKMWKIVSNPMYVADPAKGSIHNRGGAVDISLVDSKGKELDMGTAFDHFGIEASHDYKQLPAKAIENRELLKKIMTDNDFISFDSEWWHYHFKDAAKDPLSNFKWKCN